MKKKCLAFLMALAMLFALVPSVALAAETPSETVLVSIETKTIDGSYLVKPTPMPLEEGDTPVALVTRLAEQNSLAVENPTGTFIVKIGDFGSMTHGAESGWMIAVNDDDDTYPLPALKAGDTVRARFTYKTYGYDLDLIDFIDRLRVKVAEAELKMSENDGNPFNEEAGYDTDETSKYSILYAAYENAQQKQTEISTKIEENGYQYYLDSLGTMIWGGNSELDKVRELYLKLSTAVNGNEYIKANEGTISFVGGKPDKIYAGRSYPLAGSIEPANATITDFSWAVIECGGAGSISYGTFYPTTPGLAVIQMLHPDGPNAGVLTTELVDIQPTPVEDTLDQAADNIARANTSNIPNWEWAAAWSNYAAHTAQNWGKATVTDAAKQKFVDATVAAVAEKPDDANILANAINGLSAMGYDPTDITAADGTKYNAVELLKAIPWEEMSLYWQEPDAYLGIPPYILLACNQGDYGTDTLESNLIELLKSRQEDGGWGTEWGVDVTGMVLQGLAPYYNADTDAKTMADAAIEYLAAQQNETGSFGSTDSVNSDATVILALTALGIDIKGDSRFIKNDKTVADHLMTHYNGSNFGAGNYEGQPWMAAIAMSERLNGKAFYNAFDFTANTKVPAVATPEEVVDPKPPVDPEPSDTMPITFTLKTHNDTWIPKHTVQVDKDATVGDAFRQVLGSKSDFSYEENAGYVESITYNGTTLAEFTHGNNSGWKYMVNGTASAVGMDSKDLASGDDLVWYYVTDYTTDTDRDEESFVKPIPPVEPELETEDGREVVSLKPKVQAGKTGVATATLTDKDLANALKTAGKGETAAVVIAPEVTGKAKKVAVTLPKSGVADVAEAALPLRFKTEAADLTLAPEALADLGSRKGANVTLSAQTLENGAVAVEIKAGSTVVKDLQGGVKLAVPAPEAGPGTVLVLVNETGEETILKTSLPGKDMLTVTLPGSATVKVVDNTKACADVPADHWGAAATAFVTSRELFNGTGEGNFTPRGDTDRAMVMTVLYRLSGDEVVATGTEWYAEGLAWAKEKGISDGAAPTDSVSREQLATMLWRYVGTPETKGGLTAFPDGGTASDWAVEALAWAAEAGILGGDQNGALRPRDGATRVEVAVMLQRFVEHIAQ